MTQNFTDCLGVPGSITLEISQDGLQSIVNQIEVELYRSEFYRRAMTNLQALPEEASKQVQMVVKAVSRTAIRLALRQMVNQSKSGSNPAAEAIPSVSSPAPTLQEASVLPKALLDSPLTTHVLEESAAIPVERSPDPTPRVQATTATSSSVKPAKKLKKAELAQLAAIQEREDRLRQVGQKFRLARQAKALSLRQLHSQTLVPLHQLEALELGQVERLPEDIYLRGFIHRISRVLELDGASLAASVPAPDPEKAILPSWYHPLPKRGFHLHSLHLYLGYAALMAGGIAWLSQQSAPETSLQPGLLDSTDSAVQSPHTEKSTHAASTEISASNKLGISAGISPPEALMP